ncbi:Protein of unknown function [Burkholderia sp. OK233]|nr:Protein of unknown function [Burkholderia sp. OK233]
MNLVLTRLAMSVVEASVKRLTVAGEMRCACPDAFDFVVRFARDNDLPVEARIQPVVEAGQPEQASPSDWLCAKEAYDGQAIDRRLSSQVIVPRRSEQRGMRRV